ncbi:hypothetical protein ACM55I_01990, partial [Flavobacterium sp. GB2R13]|uniref:hypothetical protein n=1 Tax=Flavobacterium algoris TaxID=3398733 RepID=UPI003A849EDD
MRKIILLFILFLGAKSFAQTNGITYQAVILNPNDKQLPDVNSNTPLVSKDVCILFKFYDEYSKLEYQEVIQTKTDQYGMVNLIIGTGSQTDGYATSFETILWDSMKKSLVVGISTNGNCSSFTEISNQPFTYVPFAYSSINATNVVGVVSIENGGTNATTLLDARKNLVIENIDNTSDLNKPLSLAELNALSSKENSSNKSTNVIVDGDSDVKYPSVKSVKEYVDANVSTNNLGLESEISRAKSEETTIGANLATEAGVRTSADTALGTNLTTELTRATAAETTIAANLATETGTRASADTALHSNINTVQTTVDSNKAATDTAITGVQSDVVANKTASDLADTTLQTNINSVQTTVDSNKAGTDTAIAGVQSDVVANK